jgi:hypothetical protein
MVIGLIVALWGFTNAYVYWMHKHAPNKNPLLEEYAAFK